jgi:HlyD family secretion protein
MSAPAKPAKPAKPVKLVKPPSKPALKVVPTVKQDAVMDFQTDAIALEERRPPPVARLTLYLVALTIGCAIYWASVSRIDQIVVAPGRLTTSEPTLVMQPLETSIIRSLTVKPGDIVTKGQLLATLDPTFSSSDAGQIQSKLAGFNAQIDRLQAELKGEVYVPPAGASAEALMQGQLSAQRHSAYQAKLDDFDAQIAHGEAVLSATRSEEDMLNQRLAGLQEIQSMHGTLATSGNGSKLAFLQSQDVSLDLRVSLTRLSGQYSVATEQLQQARAERQNYVEDYRRVSLESLIDLQDQQAGAAEELRKVDLREAMSRMTAPADAAVLEVAQRSVSSVVQPAEPLITLVPLNVPLEVEATVSGSDIGHLAVGDMARIKFDAFPFQEHGTLEGKVVSISENAFSGQQGADKQSGPSFYRVRIALGDGQLRGLPQTFRMLPGMTVSAEIHAGDRTVISYFLYPLVRGLDESLREP